MNLMEVTVTVEKEWMKWTIGLFLALLPIYCSIMTITALIGYISNEIFTFQNAPEHRP